MANRKCIHILLQNLHTYGKQTSTWGRSISNSTLTVRQSSARDKVNECVRIVQWIKKSETGIQRKKLKKSLVNSKP